VSWNLRGVLFLLFFSKRKGSKRKQRPGVNRRSLRSLGARNLQANQRPELCLKNTRMESLMFCHLGLQSEKFLVIAALPPLCMAIYSQAVVRKA